MRSTTTAGDLAARLQDSGMPLVCGVVNVTPDSFSDGGRFFARSAAVEHALRLVEEGADVIDIGGESTRPGSRRPNEHEELDRVLPVVAEVVERTGCAVSVDTSRPAVMNAAVDAGAVMVNDVRGLREPGALEAVASRGVTVCVSHMSGEPGTMQLAPAYDDVVADVASYLADRAAACVRAGVEPSSIVLDPGFGFGKTLKHNLTLLSGLGDLTALGFPVMAGISRKSMLGEITGRPVDERLPASLAAGLVAAENGARMLRVHDVSATRDALAVWEAVRAIRDAQPAGGGSYSRISQTR
ncbi:dihydropteroate synthase [Nocardioides sp. NPDC000441]|uniref:dihydropteroate synthase n=1 Tax=Nocardioides sp. NPDC000441 TaxID=3154256 RepID=UPI00331F644F